MRNNLLDFSRRVKIFDIILGKAVSITCPFGEVAVFVINPKPSMWVSATISPFGFNLPVVKKAEEPPVSYSAPIIDFGGCLAVGIEGDKQPIQVSGFVVRFGLESSLFIIF